MVARSLAVPAIAVILVLYFALIPVPTARAIASSLITADVGPMAPGDSVQMGYTGFYVGGTIRWVYVLLGDLPNITLGRAPEGEANWIGFILNTGDLKECSGLMQVGVIYDSDGWHEEIMNGATGCTASPFSAQIGLGAGDEVGLEIRSSGLNTTFIVYDYTSGARTVQSLPNIGTWSNDTFQTMTEGTSVGANVSSTQYFGALVGDSNDLPVPVATGSFSFHDLAPYGGVCSEQVYALGSWVDVPSAGYLQDAFTTLGYFTSQGTCS